jgi:hypothetical protein
MTNEIFLQIWATVATVCAVFFFVRWRTSKGAAVVLVEYLMDYVGHDIQKMSQITTIVEQLRNQKSDG